MTNIVFAPGMLCNKKLWQLMLPFINPKLNCAFVDFSKCTCSKDFQYAINEKIPEGGCHLVGFSLGGYASLQYALKDSTNIHSLTLISISSEGLSDKEKALRHRLTNKVNAMKYHQMSPARLKQFVHNHYEDADAPRIIRDMEKEMGKQVLVNQMRASTDRPSLTNQLNRLTIPTTLIAAPEDQIMDANHMQMMADKIPNSHLYNIPKTGHMIPLEEPEKLAAILNKQFEI
ncbi:MAG: alpha/beta hydrolase [Emcibacteraceae bacterium]|nr:alpha/beta hydrolase [Emcibacteraceae bacterium]